MISQSKSELADVSTPKKRGRPSKDAKAQAIVSPQPSSMKAVDYENMIKPLLFFSGDYMSRASQFDGFKFSNDEADTLSKQAAEVMVELAPMINTKQGKIGIFAITAISIFGLKYLAYKEYLRENKIVKREVETHEVQSNG